MAIMRKIWKGEVVAERLKLTAMAKAAGCAAKLNPATLDAVLRKLPRQTDANVLVGFDTNDDSGSCLLEDAVALVQTVDFFTPIVDEPFNFGQIAAANALSDVYAMGGRPVSSLSLVGFPDRSDPDLLEQIIRGGLSKMTEAQCSVIGGHSIRNEDMLFGYAVTGVINPQRVWRNVGARPGDVLLFTKPLGTGVITTALKKDRAREDSVAAAVEAMCTLNRGAAAALQELEEETGGRALPPGPDVKGFGLSGLARTTRRTCAARRASDGQDFCAPCGALTRMDAIAHGIAGALLGKALFAGEDLLLLPKAAEHGPRMTASRFVTAAATLGAVFP